MRNCLFLLLLFITAPAFAAGQTESVYDRIMRTGILRCGYFVYPPYLEKDPNTGAVSGIWPELMNEVGKRLSLKIEWSDEIGMADGLTAMNAGRFDVFCSGLMAVPARARVADFLTPFYFDALYAVVRTDETRFNDPARIDDPAVKIYALEGETAQLLAQERFGRAQLVTQPNLTDPGVRFMDIVAGKGDVTFVTRATFGQFEKKNPGLLKLLGPEPLLPMRIGFMIPKNEFSLWQMLNTAIHNVNETGYSRAVIKRHGDLILPVAPPYAETP